MASWIILLMVQPVLIHKGKLKAHRFIGKLSYIIAPLMIVSMCLILRLSYHKLVLNSSIEDEMSNQAPIIMQLFSFTVLYGLAFFYRKHTFYHIRFMIGTALLMIIPIVGRILVWFVPKCRHGSHFVNVWYPKESGLETLCHCYGDTYVHFNCISWPVLESMGSIRSICSR